MKGGVSLASQGSVLARVYTSDAFIPLRNVPVVFTQDLPDGKKTVLAIRYTNSSGLTAPLLVEAPDISNSLTPDSSLKPYATVDIQVEYPGYNGVLAQDVQVFPGQETIQGLQLRPLPIFSIEDGGITIPGSSQNL